MDGTRIFHNWLSGLAVLGLMVLVAAGPAVGADRDLTVRPKGAPGSLSIGGEYRALLIGIDQYQHVPRLETAVNGAKAVRDLLVKRYGFRADHVTLLVNEQATREGIERALINLEDEAEPQDSVLIYYAGHGQTDAEKRRGWWVPVDGKEKDQITWIRNVTIKDHISSMKAKHVYLVVDSCFAGALFAQSRALPPFDDKFFAKMYADPSRWAFTSGRNEPVADHGMGGQSIFTYFWLKALQENDESYLVPSHIFNQVAPLVGRNAEQQPRSEALQGAGDQGGQFVFRLALGPEGPSKEELRAQMAKKEQELKALENQEQRVAEEEEKYKQKQELALIQKQIEQKKQQIEDKKKQLAEQQKKEEGEESKPLQEARARPNGTPQSEARARPYETPGSRPQDLLERRGALLMGRSTRLQWGCLYYTGQPLPPQPIHSERQI